MSDEVEALKKKLDDIERKTAIWRSQVVVLLLVFFVGGAAALLWTRASFASRLEAAEARITKANAAPKRVVEAEAFVVKNAAGEECARLEVIGGSGGLLVVRHKDGKRETQIWGDQVALCKTHPLRDSKEELPVPQAALGLHDDGGASLFVNGYVEDGWSVNVTQAGNVEFK